MVPITSVTWSRSAVSWRGPGRRRPAARLTANSASRSSSTRIAACINRYLDWSVIVFAPRLYSVQPHCIRASRHGVNIVDTTQGRVYRSPRRQAQAEATRAAIGRAAGRLFAERGYAGTTMQAIADEAGVAVESVYKAGSKAQLLRRAHEEAVAGDDRPIALYDRDEVRAALAVDDQRELIRTFARVLAGRAGTLTPLSRAF